jgi:hypothetical protein
MAQLDPEASSLGTDDGSASEMAAVVNVVDIDMVSQTVFKVQRLSSVMTS